MTRIKLCGLSRPCDIEAANLLLPEYIGFVFFPRSRRYVTPEQAEELERRLDPRICPVGVFVDQEPEFIAGLLNRRIIRIAQLHGQETEEDIRRLRELTDAPLIRAFRVETPQDVRAACHSSADAVLLDSGAGTGVRFDWELLKEAERPYFLAGGLDPDNVASALRTLRPYGVDVSSGIETGGKKDQRKMAAFVRAVREEERL